MRRPRLHPSTIGVFLGWGNGSLHAPTTITFGGNLSEVRLADATGDHVTDIVAADSSNTSGGVWIAAGQSGGTFAAPFELAIPEGAIDVAAGDLNRDACPTSSRSPQQAPARATRG